MKKGLVILAILVLFGIFAVGCKESSEQKIGLSFDRSTAYFEGQSALYPIAGDTPADGEAVERAVVTVRSDKAVEMSLTISFAENSDVIEGLAVVVNGAAPAPVTDGMQLYRSDTAETQAEISLTFFIRKDAPLTDRGKTLQFVFALSEWEEE